MRQFYFDDGSSRKRWHVAVKGKSQIVHYGRLGASLRESKKAFGTPAEAREQTEKLIAKKRREGYIEINPARLEIVPRKGTRKATEQQIKALEKRIGATLPEEYRNFLKTVNGGTPNPYCVQIPGIPYIENVAVGWLYRLQPSKPDYDELVHKYEQTREFIPDGHLPVANESDYFTISLKPKSYGAVFFWDHESDQMDDEGVFFESAGYLLAGSFDEFLTRIALLYGDDEEVEEKKPAKAPKAAEKPKATIKRLLRLVKHDHTPDKVKEIERMAKELGDLSGIEDGQWPFTNIDNPRVVRCLLKAGLNPEMTDTEGQSLLWQCAASRECVDLLAEKGVTIDRRSGGDHETALMRAMYLEAIPAVERLIELGANPTVRLDWPTKSKLESNDKLRKVVEKARTNWKKRKPKASAKPKAAAPATKQSGPKPTIKQFLRMMKHDYLTDECPEIPELEETIAALGDLSSIKDGEWPNIDKLESPRLVHALLQAGLNPEIVDKGGKTFLCQCVSHPECIALVLEKGVDIDRRCGKGGQNALMRATYVGDEDCVEVLLEAGADPTLEFDAFSQTLLEMDDEMTEIIEEARANWKPKKAKKTTVAKRRKK